MSFEQVNSILVADFGNVHTRLVLIDLVEGQYRMVASSRTHTTAEPPLGNVSLGLDRAAENLTELTGRRLLSGQEAQMFQMPEEDGHGIDEFLATSSAGRPIRVFLVGVTPELSLTSGRRVLAGTYASITDTLSPDDRRGEEELINDILRGDPDIVLIVGGTDNGADETLMELAGTVQRALSLIRRGTMPTVLFAGNAALKKQIEGLFSELTEVYSARNVRPTAQDEQLFPAQIELSLVYDDYRSKSPGGFAEVGRQSQIGVVPTTQGYISAIRYMGELPQRSLGPLCVDVGSANSVIMSSVHKKPHFTIHTNLGVGHNMVSTLESIGIDPIRRWLPFDITPDALWDYAYNKELRPATIPGTSEEMMIEQAFAREIVRALVAEARPAWKLGESEVLPDFNPIIGAGAVLTDVPHPGISALLLLDALQPTGMVELQLDPHNLISALGVIAYLKPVMTVQALESGGLVKLGTAFCPLGRVRYGQDVMYVQVRPVASGQVFNRTVRGGDIWMAPVLPGMTCDVTVKLRHGLTINGKGKFKVRVTAGAAGIIFDGRGRPLVMPRPKDRAMRYTRWQQAMLGRDAETPVVAPPDDLLEPEEAANALLS